MWREDGVCYSYQSYAHGRLSLHPLKDTLGHEWRDTICISKEDFPHFESVDCQATYFHQITGVKTTHNGIDSITIQNREVNYESREHFFLYLKANR